MIDDSTIILFVVIFIVLPVLLKIVWWFWVARSAFKIYKAYNAAVEEDLQRLWWAIQQQHSQEVESLRRNISSQVSTLPRNERREYTRKLSDVMDGSLKLNPVTGKWE